MKVLALLFLVGVASASIYDALEKTSDDLVVDFMMGMEHAPSLLAAVGPEFADVADEVEDEIKTALGKTLKDTLDGVLAKIRDTIDHGKEVSRELAEKAKEITQKLKEMGIRAGLKSMELVDRIKAKAADWLKDLLSKIGLGKRSITDSLGELVLSEFNVSSLLEIVMKKIIEKADLSTIIDFVKKIFSGESALGNVLIETIKAKGIAAIKALIQKILPVSNEYSLVSSWESLKEFFKGLGSNVAEKALKFTAWLKDAVKSGMENAKDKAGQLKVIAKQVIESSKTISKEAAREALEFLRPYKEDLGSVWEDLKDAVKSAIGTADF